MLLSYEYITITNLTSNNFEVLKLIFFPFFQVSPNNPILYFDYQPPFSNGEANGKLEFEDGLGMGVL